MHGGPSIRLLIVAAMCLAAIAMASCGGDGGERTKPTGIPDVDPLIAAIENKDADALLTRLTYFQEECAVDPQTDLATLYTPPQCPEGALDSTPIDVIITGNCEVGPAPADQAEQQINARFVERSQQVFAVVGPSTIFRWDFDYLLLYANTGQPDSEISGVLGVANGGVAAVAGYCGPIAESALYNTSRGGQVYWAAEGVTLRTPEANGTPATTTPPEGTPILGFQSRKYGSDLTPTP